MLLHVTCAVIRENDAYLIAQRSAAMSRPLQWEFPGGKVDGAETPEKCVVREIREELNLDVRTVRRLGESTYTYADKVIHLIPFACAITGGELRNIEHHRVAWMTFEEMRNLDWCDADRVVLEQIVAAGRGSEGGEPIVFTSPPETPGAHHTSRPAPPWSEPRAALPKT